ncbi:MAG: hypothetical protein R3F14_32400 [Polyangiaceae bacterium]
MSARELRKIGLLTSLALTGLLAAAPARADDPPPAAEGAGAGASKADGAAASGAGDGAEGKGASGATSDAASSSSDVREDPLKRYYFLGVRFRDIVLPQFMLELFTTGGATGNIWLVGPEFSTRKDGVEVDIALAYADYGFGPAMFKGNGDEDIAYEVVKSDLKVGYLTFDLLFDIPLDKSGMVSFLIGGGVGVGVVGGDLYRTQAYPKDGGAADPSDPARWEKCQFAGDGFGGYCDNGDNHYYDAAAKKDFSEPSWADGGSKPIVVPWLSIPQISLRVKPIKQLQMRADVGFSLTGFFFGASAGYGF